MIRKVIVWFDCTVFPRSSYPIFYINLIAEMGNYVLDRRYEASLNVCLWPRRLVWWWFNVNMSNSGCVVGASLAMYTNNYTEQ